MANARDVMIIPSNQWIRRLAMMSLVAIKKGWRRMVNAFSVHLTRERKTLKNVDLIHVRKGKRFYLMALAVTVKIS